MVNKFTMSSTPCDVDVAVCTYQSEKYLDECLTSIENYRRSFLLGDENT
ncbi:MAG: hypothetical protein QXQ94_11435 [Candidatus Bathyarchaeia archaeon]